MMAADVLLDTSGWIALLNASDALHAEANRVWQSILQRQRTIVLIDWVIAETGNGLARRKGSISFKDAVARIQISRRAEIVFVGSDLLEHALNLYASYQDKPWGLVDCASFALMRTRGITDAFTSDRHFEQAGYRCLLETKAGS
jgi:predicted nucleic acid-binding protein